MKTKLEIRLKHANFDIEIRIFKGSVKSTGVKPISENPYKDSIEIKNPEDCRKDVGYIPCGFGQAWCLGVFMLRNLTQTFELLDWSCPKKQLQRMCEALDRVCWECGRVTFSDLRMDLHRTCPACTKHAVEVSSLFCVEHD